MRQALRSSTVHSRAIVAAVLALALVLAISTLAWAAPSLSIDTGPSGPTRDTLPEFDFTTDPGATVECSIDQGAAVYGSCSGLGSDVPAAPLPDGDYTFRVRATAQQESTEATQQFTVDTTPPSLSVDSGPSGATTVTTPSFGFTVVDATATRLECSVDQGSPVWVSCPASPFTVAAPLADGRYTFRVRATDAAGNQGGASHDFTIDSTAPSLTIPDPRDPTNDTTPSLAFTAEAGTTTMCSVDQGPPAWVPCPTSPYTPLAPLPDGPYRFSVTATDRAGNVASESKSFMVDTTPPSLTIDFGPSGATSDSTPLFGFTAEVGATVECSIDQGTAAWGPCASATTGAAFAPLADGAYIFRVQATDAAGNQTVAMRTFTIDTAPAPSPDPTPPVAPPVTPTPVKLELLSPFPLVRISGTLTGTGAHISLLSVRAPRGALVRATVTPACGRRRRSSRACRVLRVAATVGSSDAVTLRRLARTYRSGTVIVVRIWRAGRIGKYTRFTIVRGKAPVRIDECLMPAATHGSRCPSN
jgi:hypothetical protein